MIRTVLEIEGLEDFARSELDTGGLDSLEWSEAGNRTRHFGKARCDDLGLDSLESSELEKKGLGKVIYGDGRTGWLNNFRLETKGPDSLLRSEVERGVLLLF